MLDYILAQTVGKYLFKKISVLVQELYELLDSVPAAYLWLVLVAKDQIR